jgi:hypothetical protein
MTVRVSCMLLLLILVSKQKPYCKNKVQDARHKAQGTRYKIQGTSTVIPNRCKHPFFNFIELEDLGLKDLSLEF